GLGRGDLDGRLVERLGGVHVDHTDVDPATFGELGGLAGHADHEPVRDDGHVVAVGQGFGPTEREALARGVDLGDAGTADADVDRAVVLGRGTDEGGGRDFVGGVGDGEAGKRARDRDVLDRLLRRAVFTERDAAETAHEVHVELHVSATDPQLLIALADEEGREARGKGDHATGGQAGGNR